jgi:hypothetical protein
MLGDVSQSTKAVEYGRGIVCRRALVVPGIVCMMLSLLACGTAGSGGGVSWETDQQVHREFVSGLRDAIAKTSAWPRRDLFAQYPDRF